MFFFGVFRGAYDSNNFAAFFDVVEPRYHASAAGFNLMIAFLFGCFSPTVLGWTKAHYSMSSGLASLALAYLVGAALLVVGGRIFCRETLQRANFCVREHGRDPYGNQEKD